MKPEDFDLSPEYQKSCFMEFENLEGEE